MERFYANPEAFDEKEARVTGDELKHLKNVLRLKAGDRVEVFDGRGRGYTGLLTEVNQTEALVALETPVKEARDSALRVCLAQGLPKGDRMDWIVQKATELGVFSIAPLELSRCTVRLEGEKKRRDKRSRWQKIAAEAARQCGRLWVPEVLPPMELSAFLSRISMSDLLLIPWEEGGASLKPFFAETADPSAAGAAGAQNKSASDQRLIHVMIGPEGGMTQEEVEAGRSAGGKILTLGPRILRTDTAGLMLLSVLQYQWGDMGDHMNGKDGGAHEGYPLPKTRGKPDQLFGGTQTGGKRADRSHERAGRSPRDGACTGGL